MLQAIEAGESLQEQVQTMPPTPRVERLKQRYLETKNKVVIDVLRIRTRVMKETEGEPRASRQAKAFAATVRELPINIYPDELLVGWMFSEPHGSPLMPAQAVGMEGELDILSTREHMPFLISDKIKRELREEIIPYWRSHLKNFGIESLTHWTGGYEKVLEKGILGVKRDAEEELTKLDRANPDHFRKALFVESVILALEAAAEVGTRFAAKARELAAKEKDDQRASELRRIAEICEYVPANPARTLYEAIQSVWFVQIMYAWDNEWAWGISPGRADQLSLIHI